MDCIVFSTRLKESLKEKNISQAALSREVSRDKITVYRWTKGDYMPPLDTIKHIAAFLGVRYEYLIGLDNFKTEQEILETNINMTDEEKAKIIEYSFNVLSEFGTQLSEVEEMLKSRFFAKYDFSKVKDKITFYCYLRSAIEQSINTYMTFFNQRNTIDAEEGENNA